MVRKNLKVAKRNENEQEFANSGNHCKTAKRRF